MDSKRWCTRTGLRDALHGRVPGRRIGSLRLATITTVAENASVCGGLMLPVAVLGGVLMPGRKRAAPFR